MRELPEYTKGGNLGEKFRLKTGKTTDTILTIIYSVVFIYLLLNKRASYSIVLASRILRSLEYLLKYY